MTGVEATFECIETFEEYQSRLTDSNSSSVLMGISNRWDKTFMDSDSLKITQSLAIVDIILIKSINKKRFFEFSNLPEGWTSMFLLLLALSGAFSAVFSEKYDLKSVYNSVSDSFQSVFASYRNSRDSGEASIVKLMVMFVMTFIIIRYTVGLTLNIWLRKTENLVEFSKRSSQEVVVPLSFYELVTLSEIVREVSEDSSIEGQQLLYETAKNSSFFFCTDSISFQMLQALDCDTAINFDTLFTFPIVGVYGPAADEIEASYSLYSLSSFSPASEGKYNLLESSFYRTVDELIASATALGLVYNDLINEEIQRLVPESEECSEYEADDLLKVETFDLVWGIFLLLVASVEIAVISKIARISLRYLVNIEKPKNPFFRESLIWMSGGEKDLENLYFSNLKKCIKEQGYLYTAFSFYYITAWSEINFYKLFTKMKAVRTRLPKNKLIISWWRANQRLLKEKMQKSKTPISNRAISSKRCSLRISRNNPYGEEGFAFFEEKWKRNRENEEILKSACSSKKISLSGVSGSARNIMMDPLNGESALEEEKSCFKSTINAGSKSDRNILGLGFGNNETGRRGKERPWLKFKKAKEKRKSSLASILKIKELFNPKKKKQDMRRDNLKSKADGQSESSEKRNETFVLPLWKTNSFYSCCELSYKVILARLVSMWLDCPEQNFFDLSKWTKSYLNAGTRKEFLVVSNQVYFDRMSPWEREKYQNNGAEFGQVNIQMEKINELIEKYEKRFTRASFMGGHFSMEQLDKIKLIKPKYAEQVAGYNWAREFSFFDLLSQIFCDKRMAERHLRKALKRKNSRIMNKRLTGRIEGFLNLQDKEHVGDMRGSEERQTNRVMRNYQDDPEFLLSFQSMLRKKYMEINNAPIPS